MRGEKAGVSRLYPGPLHRQSGVASGKGRNQVLCQERAESPVVEVMPAVRRSEKARRGYLTPRGRNDRFGPDTACYRIAQSGDSQISLIGRAFWPQKRRNCAARSAFHRQCRRLTRHDCVGADDRDPREIAFDLIDDPGAQAGHQVITATRGVSAVRARRDVMECRSKWVRRAGCRLADMGALLVVDCEVGSYGSRSYFDPTGSPGGASATGMKGRWRGNLRGQSAAGRGSWCSS
jgi:hypothetical protein